MYLYKIISKKLSISGQVFTIQPIKQDNQILNV